MKLNTFLLKCALFVGGLILSACALAKDGERNGVNDTEVVLGQSLGMTGPMAAMAQEIRNGQQAYFQALNKKGGVNGRHIRVVTMDDGFVPLNAQNNVTQLLQHEKVFALFNFVGTGTSAAALPLIDKDEVPFFTPFSGSELFRQSKLHHVFNIRASHENEIDKLTQHLSTLGLRRLALVFQNNDFGKEGLSLLEKAMLNHPFSVVSKVSLETDLRDANRAAAIVSAAKPDALIVFVEGRPAVDFVRIFRSANQGLPLYTLSAMGGLSATLKALGNDGVGVVMTAVVPFPWGRREALTLAYQADMRKAGFNNFSFVSYEAYINAKVLAEGIRRAGRDLTRPRLIQAMDELGTMNMGGFEVNFSKGARQASRMVVLTLIAPNEKFRQ